MTTTIDAAAPEIPGLTADQAVHATAQGAAYLAKIKKLAKARRAARVQADMDVIPEPEVPPAPTENEALIADLIETAEETVETTPEDSADFQEVEIAIPADPAPLPDARRRATHYEADAYGFAAFRSAAAQHGERVTYAPSAIGGELHRAVADALGAAGWGPGDGITWQDLRLVPGQRPDQARYGTEASCRTGLHRLANSGLITRHAVGGNRRPAGYSLAPHFFLASVPFPAGTPEWQGYVASRPWLARMIEEATQA